MVRSRGGNSMVMIPAGARRIFIPPTKSFRSGTCASTLLPSMRSACWPASASSRAVSTPKNFTRVGTPFDSATFATLAAGSIPREGIPPRTEHWSGREPEARNPALHEILEKVSIVAGDLDDFAFARQCQLVDHLIDITLAVLEPGVGERGEVGVVGEDVFTGHVFLQLHQKAPFADPDVKR